MSEDEFVPAGRPADLRQGETWCACGAIWRAASRICHCATCHRTFTGLSGFDGHRVTVCADCTPENPCERGRHQGETRTLCLSGVTSLTEIAPDASGRCKAPSNSPPPQNRSREAETAQPEDSVFVG